MDSLGIAERLSDKIAPWLKPEFMKLHRMRQDPTIKEWLTVIEILFTSVNVIKERHLGISQT